jgi:hypothetical protein
MIEAASSDIDFVRAIADLICERGAARVAKRPDCTGLSSMVLRFAFVERKSDLETVIHATAWAPAARRQFAQWQLARCIGSAVALKRICPQ